MQLSLTVLLILFGLSLYGYIKTNRIFNNIIDDGKFNCVITGYYIKNSSNLFYLNLIGMNKHFEKCTYLNYEEANRYDFLEFFGDVSIGKKAQWRKDGKHCKEYEKYNENKAGNYFLLSLFLLVVCICSGFLSLIFIYEFVKHSM